LVVKDEELVKDVIKKIKLEKGLEWGLRMNKSPNLPK
jgi:hypothetical protein